MKIKTINTESTGYNLVREGYALLAGAGSVTAVTSVVLPFVETVWKGRPVWRFLGKIGTLTLSTFAGVYGSSTGAVTVDSFAGVYNRIADRVNGTKKAEPEVEPEPKVKTKMYRKDIDILNDYIVETKMFEFGSEEEAKKALEWLTNMLNDGILDFMDVAGYYAILRQGEIPTENKKLYDILTTHGWTKEDTKDWFVEQTDDNTWFFGATNYHDISDKFKTLKESDLTGVKE